MQKHSFKEHIVSLKAEDTGSQASFKLPVARVKSFAADQGGSFLPTFALGVMTIFMCVGAAVDYSQLSQTRSVVGNSLDAAVLATGSEMLRTAPGDAKLRSVFEDYLYSNLSRDQKLMNRVTIQSFNVDRVSGKVSAELKTPVDMAFLGLFGRPEIPVNSVSEAKFSTSPVEISMMLDVTGSMRHDGKLDALKLAAQDAIDILLPQGTATSSVRVGLVPYAAGVNGGNYARIATDTNRTCATERTGNPHSDAYYGTSPLGADPNANCPSARVQPLTDNANELKRQVRGYRPAGYTAGHLGIGWSYYLLSENWQRLWPNGSKPDDYGTDTKKIAILMTDGEFNTFYRGVNNNHQGGHAELSNAEAIALCDDMKRSKRGGDGITVYSVAFNAPNSAKATLQACASPDDATATHFFDANSGAELRAAFREIATSIKSLRLSR